MSGYRSNYKQNNSHQESGSGGYGVKRTLERNDRVDPPPLSIQQIILNVGEKEEDLGLFVDTLLSEYFRSKDDIIDALEICICEIPFKTSVYAKIIWHLNGRNPDCVQDILLNVVEALEVFYKREYSIQILLIVRFFGVCAALGVVSLSSLLSLFDEFEAVGLENREMYAWHMYIILNALPFVGKLLSNNAPDYLKGLMKKFEYFLEKDFVPPKHRFDSDNCLMNNSVEINALSYLYDTLLQLKSNHWNIDNIFTGFPFLFSNENEMKCSRGGASLLSTEHDLRRVKIRGLLPNFGQIPTLLLLHLFDHSKESITSGGREESNFSQFYILENIRMTCLLFESNYKKGLETITASFLEFPSSVDIVIESLFSCLFNSDINGKSIKTEAFLIGMCRIKPSVAPFLGKVIRHFYANANLYGHEILFKFNNWFADHLINYDLKWNWIEWEDALDFPLGENSQRVLLEDLIDRLGRLCYVDRIKEAFPTTFRELINELCDNGNGELAPLCDNREAESQTAVLDEISKFLRLKIPESELLQFLKEKSNILSASKDADTLHESICLFLKAFFRVSSSTLSHSITYLERYKLIFNAITADEKRPDLILNELFSFWKTNIQSFELFCEKLILYKIVSCSMFVNWFFTTIPPAYLIKYKWWNVLFICIDRLKLRIKQQSDKLQALKENHTDDCDDREIKESLNAINYYSNELNVSLKTILQNIEMILQMPQQSSPALSKTLLFITRWIQQLQH